LARFGGSADISVAERAQEGDDVVHFGIAERRRIALAAVVRLSVVLTLATCCAGRSSNFLTLPSRFSGYHFSGLVSRCT
jgi:hypothetical protein